jgi:hypothetical protein
LFSDERLKKKTKLSLSEYRKRKANDTPRPTKEQPLKKKTVDQSENVATFNLVTTVNATIAEPTTLLTFVMGSNDIELAAIDAEIESSANDNVDKSAEPINISFEEEQSPLHIVKALQPSTPEYYSGNAIDTVADATIIHTEKSNEAIELPKTPDINELIMPETPTKNIAAVKELLTPPSQTQILIEAANNATQPTISGPSTEIELSFLDNIDKNNPEV